MTNLSDLIAIDIWGVAKWFYVAGFGLYLIFSLVVWRQINLMSKALMGTLQLPIKMVGATLAIVAAVVLVLAVMVL